MSESQSRWGRAAFALLALGLLLVQLALIVRQAAPELARIRQDAGKAGLWRSANFTFNLEIADYLAWINHQVPADVPILVGADTGPETLSKPAALQVFLYPRRVYNCPGDGYLACLEAALDAGQAALVTTPDRVDVNTWAEYQPFSDQWGLLYRGPAAEASPTGWRDFDALANAALRLAPPLLALLGLTLVGFMLVARLAPNLDRTAQAALGFGLGSGAFSLLVFLALLLGFELSRGLLWALLALALIGALAAWRRRPAATRAAAAGDGSAWLGLLLVILLGALVALLAVGRGYARSDEYLLWGAKGYGIPAAGLQSGVSEWGTLSPRYPLNIPLLIGSFLTWFGDWLPESKLIFPCFYVALLLVVLAFLRKRFNGALPIVGTAILATSPLVFLHGTLAYANLPYTFFLVSGFLLAVDSLESGAGRAPAWLAGLLLAGAAWTRPEGLAINWVLIPALILLAYGRASLVRWRDWAPWIVPTLVYSLFWGWAASAAYAGRGFSSGLLGGGLSALLGGNLNWEELGFLLSNFAQQLTDFSVWAGLAIPLLAFALLWLLNRRSGISRGARLLLALGAIFVAIILASYYLTSYQTATADISWWVSTGLDRMLMPGLLLLALAALIGCANWLGLVQTTPEK